MKIQAYTYNASLKDCCSPDELHINVMSVVLVEPEPRPVISDKKYFRVYFNNRDMKHIDEDDAKKIIERLK